MITWGMIPSGVASAENTTIVTVSAPSVVNTGEQFTVSISVEPGTTIAGVQCNLSFDQSLITANGVVEGDLLSQGGATTYFNPGVINNATGSVSGVVGVIITPGQTISTAGTFAQVTITAGVIGGSCPLTLSGVIVGDENGQPVPVNVVNSQVIINSQGAINHEPVLNFIDNKLVNEGNLLQFTISAFDADGDILTFFVSNLPSGANFDSEARTFSWTPTYGQRGDYPDIQFSVTDGELSDTEDVTITVTKDDPPVLQTIGNKSISENEILEFEILAIDPENGSLAFSADNLPDGASFDIETGVFVWTPESGQAGEYAAVHFEVCDGELTDSEDISIIVLSMEENVKDTTLPVIQEVMASNITTDSAVISWTTSEPSTSQVEYWASPSQFSPLYDTLVTEHEVRLTGLIPGTEYNYRTLSQDEAGNLAISPSCEFYTTPTEPTTFTVSWITINPAETTIGNEVTIGALVTNTGGATGDYDVTLSINSTVESTESIIDLPSGASQEVTFVITRDTPGIYNININGNTDTFVIKDDEEVGVVIDLFSITPNYEEDVGVITFAKVDYGINESYYSSLFIECNTELILQVGLHDKILEEVILVKSEQLEQYDSTGSLNYVPSDGWVNGVYTFQAEVRTSEGIIEVSPQIKLMVTPIALTHVVNWAVLVEIIGGALVIGLFVVCVILSHNRDMLRSQPME